jgi:Rps23 Pro-64 3,4-dihydroxylase Tpa1-like proline 4-hydroxylase
LGGTIVEVPFRHVVIDQFLPDHFADKIYRELKKVEITPEWYRYENHFEKKIATDNWSLFPPTVNHFFLTSFASPFIEMVEKYMGIDGLIPDPHLRGGGVHIHLTGTKLDVHKDFVYLDKLKLYRRVNAIWFANKQWDEEWNGALEFWSKDMQSCVRKIYPKFNRLVIFETPNSPHGLPEEIKCPDIHRRMSLAMYFYSVEKPKGIGDEKHSTMFLKRPGDETSEEIEALRAKRNQGRLDSNVKG